METTIARLVQLCADEEVEADEEALRTISRAAAGSLRDAENLLEQALVSYGSPLGEDQVGELLGLTSDERALELVGHVVNRSVGEGLTVINEVASDGVDLRQFHRSVLEYLRGVVLIKSGAGTSLGHAKETEAQMRSVADRASPEHLVRALKTFAGADVRRDGSTPLPLELALVESNLETQAPPTEAVPSQEAPVKRAPVTAGPVSAPPRAPPQPREPAIPPRAEPAPPTENRERTPDELPAEPQGRLESQWNQVLRSLDRRKGKRFDLGALLRSSTGREVSDGTITLKYSHASHQERMQEELDDPQTSRLLREAFGEIMDGTYEIQAALADTQGNGPGKSASQRSHLVRAAQAMGAQVVGEKEEDHE
jgi:DNA polymerase-3 subunit gamma/tau